MPALWGVVGVPMVSQAFLEFTSSHDLRNLYGRVIPENPKKRVGQKGNLCCSITGEEQRNKWIPCVCTRLLVASLISPPFCWTTVLVSSSKYRRREAVLGREGRVLRQLDIWCSYLLSACICEAHSILVLLQRDFLHGLWPCRLRMTLRYFTKLES